MSLLLFTRSSPTRAPLGAFTFIPLPRQRNVCRRPATFKLDMNHPMARELVFAMIGELAGGMAAVDSGPCRTVGAAYRTDHPLWIENANIGRMTARVSSSNQRFTFDRAVPWSNEFTVAVWYTRNGTGSGLELIFMEFDSAANRRQWGLAIRPADSLAVLILGTTDGLSYTEYATPFVVAIGDTVHFAATVRVEGGSSIYAVYANGRQVLSGTTSTDPAAHGSVVTIGGSTLSSYCNGQIADAIKWNRILTPAEIARLADPSNVMLDGLVRHLQRTLLPVSFAVNPGLVTVSDSYVTRSIVPLKRRACVGRPSEFAINVSHGLAYKLDFAGLGCRTGDAAYCDSSAFRRHGIISGVSLANAWVYDNVLARRALQLDGIDDQVILPRGVWSYGLTSPLSLSFWFRTSNTAADIDFAIGARFDSTNYIHCGPVGGPGAKAFNWGQMPTNVTSTTNTWNDGIWHHATCTRKPGGLVYEIWIDGKLQRSASYASTLDASYPEATIGNYGGASHWFNGNVADPMLWGRELSPAEIVRLADPSNFMLDGLLQEVRARTIPIERTTTRFTMPTSGWMPLPRRLSVRPPEFTVEPTHGLAKGLRFAMLGGGGQIAEHMRDSSAYGHTISIKGRSADSTLVYVPELGRPGLNVTSITPSNYAESTLNMCGESTITSAAWVLVRAPIKRGSFGCQGGYYDLTAPWFWGINAESGPVRIGFSLQQTTGFYLDRQDADVLGLHHYVLVYDVATNLRRIYIDGVNRGMSASWGSPIPIPTLDVKHRISSWAGQLNAIISDVMTWDRVLTDAEIAILANPRDTLLSGLLKPARQRLINAIPNTMVWSSLGSRNWNCPENWSHGVVPGPEHNALFNNTSVVSCDVNEAATVRKLTVEHGYTGTIDMLDVPPRRHTILEEATFASGGGWIDTGKADVYFMGPVWFTGGQLVRLNSGPWYVYSDYSTDGSPVITWTVETTQTVYFAGIDKTIRVESWRQYLSNIVFTGTYRLVNVAGNDNRLTCSNLLKMEVGSALVLDGSTAINVDNGNFWAEGGSITGAGTISVSCSNSDYFRIDPAAYVAPASANLSVQHTVMSASGGLYPGTINCNFIMAMYAAATRYWPVQSGTFLVNGNLELRNAAAADCYVRSATTGGVIAVTGNVTQYVSAAGRVTLETVDFEVVGTGDQSVNMGTANHTATFIVDKPSGRATFAANANMGTFSGVDGDCDFNGYTMTVSGNVTFDGSTGFRLWDGATADQSNATIDYDGSLTIRGTAITQLAVTNLDFVNTIADTSYVEYATVTNSQKTGTGWDINAYTGPGNIDNGSNVGWIFVIMGGLHHIEAGNIYGMSGTGQAIQDLERGIIA